MTKAEPVVVKSLRGLDALVSDKVFGEPLTKVPRVRINGHWRDDETWLAANADPANPPLGTWRGQRPPRYSTDIAAAWEVVEKLIGDGAEPLIVGWAKYTQDWHCEIRGISTPDGAQLHDAAAETAPLAISLAALRAKGIEVTPAWE